MTPLPISVPLSNPATPVVYQLQGTGEIDIKSIVATFNGASAATDFYPVISIYSSDDRLLSRTRVQEAIPAGGSGVVTFAPFLRQAASQGSEQPFANCYSERKDTTGGSTFTFCDLAVVTTNALDTFSLETRTSPVGTGAIGLSIHTPGTYLIRGQAQGDKLISDLPNPEDYLGTVEVAGDFFWPDLQIEGPDDQRGYRNVVATPSGHWRPWVEVVGTVKVDLGGGSIVIGFRQNSGINVPFYGVLFVVKLSTLTTWDQIPP